MKEEKDILAEAGRKDGMTVPEGFFSDFAVRMAESLERTPYEESAYTPDIHKPRTFWQRVRPYVYMAAMFAGVWCMLKMFTLMSGRPGLQPSPILAEALQNETFVNDYVLNNVDQWDIMDQMLNDGFDLELLDDSDAAYGDTNETVEP